MPAMQAESLEVLEQANVPATQARAIVRAIEIEIAGATDTLATKHDIAPVKHDITLIKHDITLIKRDITQLDSRMESRCAALETKIESRYGALDAKVESRHGAIETKLEAVRGELRVEIRDLRSQMHAAASRNAWLLYGALVTQITTLLGVGYLFVTHVTR